MSARPGIPEGMVVALLASLGGAAVFALLSTVFGNGFLRLIVALLAFAYVLYLLLRSPERTGRISIMLLWTGAALLNLLLAPTLPLYLLVHLLLIWLIRALYYYHGLLPALMDLGLIGLAVPVAAWAWLSTHSLFMTLWCFFLVQSLYALIPARISGRKAATTRNTAQHHAFDEACRSAELAARKLSNLH